MQQIEAKTKHNRQFDRMQGDYVRSPIGEFSTYVCAVWRGSSGGLEWGNEDIMQLQKKPHIRFGSCAWGECEIFRLFGRVCRESPRTEDPKESQQCWM